MRVLVEIKSFEYEYSEKLYSSTSTVLEYSVIAIGQPKSLTDRPQTKFQSDLSESFQCIVSNRCFISQKKPKFSVCANIF